MQGNDTVGGLLGSANRLTVENSYSTGAVSGNDAVGGLIGTSRDSTVWRSFWDTQTSGQSSSDGGEGKTTVELKNLATYTSPGVTVTFDSYSYTTANDSPDVRDPISWTLFGSNNGSDWTEIDSRADQTITDERETETSVFSLSGDATYSYLKWEITKRKGTGDCCVQAADLNLYLNTSPVSWPGSVFVTNPNGEGPDDEGPNNLTDGISSTKWLDNQFSEDEEQDGFTELIFDMNGRVWDIEASDNELNDGYPYLSWQVGGSSPVWYVSGSVEASNSSSEQPSASGDSGSVPSCNDPEPSGVPDLFRIDSAGTYANLYFTGIDGSSGYSINYGLTPQADQYGDLFHGASGWVIGRTISGLSPNTTYYFKVQALNGCNAVLRLLKVLTPFEVASQDNKTKEIVLKFSRPEYEEKITNFVTQAQTVIKRTYEYLSLIEEIEQKYFDGMKLSNTGLDKPDFSPEKVQMSINEIIERHNGNMQDVIKLFARTSFGLWSFKIDGFDSYLLTAEQKIDNEWISLQLKRLELEAKKC